MKRKSNKTWFVYLVRCSDGSIYTGISTDVARRVYEHNLTGRGAKYTKARRPVHLVFSFQVGSQGDALKLECRIKKISRKRKEMIIQNQSLEGILNLQKKD